MPARVFRLRYGYDRKALPAPGNPPSSLTKVRAQFLVCAGMFQGPMSPCHGQLQAEWVPSTPQTPLKDGRSFLKTLPKFSQKMADVLVPDETKRGGGICPEGVERTWAMKFLGLSHTACPLLAASITPALANRFGWRAACYCYGLLNIAVGALLFIPALSPAFGCSLFVHKGVWQLFEPEPFEPEDCGCCGWQACCGSCWCRSTNSPPPGENSPPQAGSEIGGSGFGKTPG
eukprot:COSAG04_NODE_224_length_19624_cov_47.932855_13_plen_231_part_00